jgi:quercetin dioxygenase-like cupin family protein
VVDITEVSKEVTMATMEVKHTDSPDETRPFADKGRAQVVKVGDTTIVRGTFEPGWRWSQHVKPLAGTESCQAAHTGYMVSGRMHVQMDDGSEQEAGPGDAVSIPAGHDAWIVGNETCVFIDFTAPDYATRR